MPASASRSVYLMDRYWAATVALVNQPYALYRAAFVDRLFEGIENEASMRGRADAPMAKVAGRVHGRECRDMPRETYQPPSSGISLSGAR